jgi:hypothetical protein
MRAFASAIKTLHVFARLGVIKSFCGFRVDGEDKWHNQTGQQNAPISNR